MLWLAKGLAVDVRCACLQIAMFPLFSFVFAHQFSCAPSVRLTTTKQEADVYISIPFFTAEEEHRNLSASDWAKTIVIDNTDGFFAQHLCVAN